MHRPPTKPLFWIIILIVADQVSKLIVRHTLLLGESIDILPFLKLTHITNRGIAFGALEGRLGLILVVSSLVVLALVLAMLTASQNSRMTMPLVLLVAGSAGNLLDRIYQGGVTDFLRLPHWPSFNIADIYIVAGVSILILSLLFSPNQNFYQKQAG